MTVNYRLILTLLMLNTLMSCNAALADVEKKNDFINMKKDTIVFGAGCFWCVEAVFQQLKGVVSVKPGYCDGKIKNPTYEQVCSGMTGHNEVARIIYDSSLISYVELLEVFWKTHDPTTLNRQGNDIGTQYRSGIYCNNDEQLKLAETYKEKLNSSGLWKNPIVTEIKRLDVFYSAEKYHVNYYNLNKNQPYCQFVIQPKIDKFRKVFNDKLAD
ncbi:MAG: peptide-methionine (S)-S-oxide reductase [Crocinitomicaceae bacterium]|nr:peptide-methionine (S)-S-oxide reductase [Crocinitomicaceae bacterium]|tara:strand:+ start:231 stop:872 length:642 start_codon:yes stop_codon:yes gene_type:complete